MKDVLAKLNDIEGLDPISWWPLAPAWWICGALLIVLFSALTFLFMRQCAFRRSWKKGTLDHLNRIETQLSKDVERSTIIELSELIRRIAMQKYSRHECAGLEGDKWLEWLTSHDPSGFDWTEKGGFIIEAPYAALDKEISKKSVSEVIKAVRGWIK